MIMENLENLETLNINFTEYKTRLNNKFRNRVPYQSATPGIVVSFIPGTVVELLVKVGDKVGYGDELLVLDAMKMKNRILAHWAGTVTKIMVNPGDRIPKGTVLLEIGQ
jgi:pyruvate carboxylase